MLASKNYIFQSITIAICLVMASFTSIQAEEKNTNQYSMQSMSSAMQKSMDPNVWSNMMAMMMNPEKAMSMESCAQCHDAEDVARYAKDFGPMMEAMKPMMSMMNPNMYMNMMYPMMGMMNPMAYMNMMGPMMGMMNPMMASMMNPMAYMNMMGPMMGMGGMGSMMNPMGMMGGMGMPGMSAHGSNPMGQMPGGQMMDPKQYEQWFSQWTEMMKNMTPQPQANQ
jgi:hypothetical protein